LKKTAGQRAERGVSVVKTAAATDLDRLIARALLAMSPNPA